MKRLFQQKRNEIMEQKEGNERIRKQSKWGAVTQKMMSFKIDLDIMEKLKGESNKGRLVNNLLRQHYGLADEDASPEEHSLEEYMT